MLPEKAYVIYNEELGVYIGDFLGASFWSNLDPVGQNCAVAFTDGEVINSILERFKKYDKKHGHDFSYKLVGVDVSHIEGTRLYASVDSCVNAGLPAWSF